MSQLEFGLRLLKHYVKNHRSGTWTRGSSVSKNLTIEEVVVRYCVSRPDPARSARSAVKRYLRTV